MPTCRPSLFPTLALSALLAMLPLGVGYFTIAVTLLAMSLAFIAAPIAVWTGLATANVDYAGWQVVGLDGTAWGTSAEAWMLPLMLLGGVLLLFITLHVARGIGRLHGMLAKHLLVKSAQYN